jgi:hypothetical protein
MIQAIMKKLYQTIIEPVRVIPESGLSKRPENPELLSPGVNGTRSEATVRWHGRGIFPALYQHSY